MVLRRKLETSVEESQAAAEFADRKLATKTILDWKAKARLAPISRRVVELVNTRTSRQSFALWRTRAQQSVQANEFNRLRLIRNSTHAWNEHLRMQVVQKRIDDRVVMQALYRWVLAERARLLTRLNQRKVKSQILGLLEEKTSENVARLARREHAFRTGRDSKLKASVLSHWRYRLSEQREKEQMANAFYEPRLLGESLGSWTSRLDQLRQLNTWAEDAELYFKSKKTLRVWQEAVTESQRRKRRNAYSQVRRTVKRNLAVRAFQHWRISTAHAVELNQQAETIDQNRVIMSSIDQLENWRDRYQQNVEMSQRAEQAHEEILLRRAFKSWTDRQNNQRQRDQLAEAHAHVRTVRTAEIVLRRFAMQVISYRSMDEGADLLKARNDRAHFRDIFRMWHAKTVYKRSPRGRREAIENSPFNMGSLRRSLFARPSPPVNHPADESPAPAPATNTQFGATQPYDDALGRTRRAEDWTAFEEEFSVGEWIPAPASEARAPPTLGYLSTPSKRAARAREIVGLSETPRTPRLFGTPRAARTAPAMFGQTSPEPDGSSIAITSRLRGPVEPDVSTTPAAAPPEQPPLPSAESTPGPRALFARRGGGPSSEMLSRSVFGKSILGKRKS